MENMRADITGTTAIMTASMTSLDGHLFLDEIAVNAFEQSLLTIDNLVSVDTVKPTV